jgi:hypothetical protein
LDCGALTPLSFFVFCSAEQQLDVMTKAASKRRSPKVHKAEVGPDPRPLGKRVPDVSSDEALTLSLEQKVDQVCMRFEAGWISGAPPRIEDYLADLADAKKGEVLRALILLDVYYRQKRGETCRTAIVTFISSVIDSPPQPSQSFLPMKVQVSLRSRFRSVLFSS